MTKLISILKKNLIILTRYVYTKLFEEMQDEIEHATFTANRSHFPMVRFPFSKFCFQVHDNELPVNKIKAL